METIKMRTGLKQYGIEDEHGEIVAVLTLDTMNNNIVNLFADLVNRAEEIKKEFEKEYNKVDEEKATAENIKWITEIYRKSVNDLINETEKVFGEGLIHDIFSKNYELDENFIPDLSALTEFYEQIVPIIRSVYQSENKPKYTPAKKGKRSKEEMIAEFKEKVANEE